MSTEPHTLQPDPPEGDRDVVERELKRQDEKSKREPAADDRGAPNDKTGPEL